MNQFRLTVDAQSDLIEIRRYTLEKWGSEQSQKYLAELLKTVSILSENPLIGKEREDISNKVFSFPHLSHVIYYLVHDGQLIVFGLLDKAMVPQNHLENRQTF